MQKNSNPVFSKIDIGTTHYEDVDAASYKGITLKTAIFLLITIAIAAVTSYFLPTMLANNPTGLYVALGVTSFIGVFAVIFGRFSTRAAKYAGVIYSACEGLFLGVMTTLFEMLFPGTHIATLAIFSTVIIFGVMLTLYAVGVLRNGTFFRKLAYAISFGAIALLLFSTIFGIFFPMVFQNMGVLIGLEAFFLIYGAITLIINFDEATYVVQSGCTKDAEWSVSLGLSISLIYIYIEALRLIALILASNQDN